MSDAVHRGGEIDEMLLDVKLSIPQPRAGMVRRAGLINAVRASACRVVGVTAPAGYGKSTLLAEWAAAEDRPVAWVSFDRFDDDPAALVALLAAAYARVSKASADLVADVSGQGVSVLARAAPRLAAALSSSPTPFVLMLDDLHELQTPACHDVLEIVIAGVPQGSQLVAASRSEQSHLPRLRASGDGMELGVSDLALDTAGAERIFEAAQVTLTHELATSMTERTEGWPAGLHLAALIASETHGHTTTISGDDRYVADYLYREALAQLPEATQGFLRCTSVLDQLCAPLCDAILEQSNAQNMLRDLEASSMFVIPLDRRREWYRYHALFREFLLSELLRVDPDMVTKLHLRAAEWYDTNGSPGVAVEHLLLTNDRDRAVEAVTALALPTYQAGQLSTIQRWFAALGASVIEQHPPLSVLQAWIVSSAGEPAEADRWAAIIDAASFDGVPLDGTASFDSSRAMLRSMRCASGPEQAMEDASVAVAQEPAWSVWRDCALLVYAEAHLLIGEVERATELFAAASAVPATNSSTEILFMSESELGTLAMDAGRWTDAAEHLDVALATIELHRMDDYTMSALAFGGAARLAVHRGDRREADRQLTRAMRARQSCTWALPYFAVRIRLQLARVFASIAQPTTAHHLLREIDDVLLHRPALGILVQEVSDLRAVLASSGTVGATGASPLTPAELRVLPYLQTHLTLREIAERLFVSRNTVNSEVAAIYRKLEVNSRNEAVDRAMAVGLLGG